MLVIGQETDYPDVNVRTRRRTRQSWPPLITATNEKCNQWS